MPGLAAVVGALNDLSEPTAGLRSVNAIRICERAFKVIHLPASEVRAADFPVLALAVGGKNECAFARTCQDTNLAHVLLPNMPILSEGAIWESTRYLDGGVAARS